MKYQDIMDELRGEVHPRVANVIIKLFEAKAADAQKIKEMEALVMTMANAIDDLATILNRATPALKELVERHERRFRSVSSEDIPTTDDKD